MTVTYRAARGQDAEACAQIIYEWSLETPWLGPLNPLDEVAAFWRDLLELDTAWVADVQGAVVGFCVRDEDNIGGLYVATQARGRGVGKKLLDLAKAQRGWITVWAYEENPRARAFYRREGLVEIGRDVEERSGLVDIEHRWTRSPAV